MMTALLTVVASLIQSAWANPTIKTSTVEILDVRLDKPYPAMEGPIRSVPIMLNLGPNVKTAWILGVQTEILENGQPAIQYLCHARLGSFPADYQLAGMRTIRSDKETKTRFLLPLTQGHSDMMLPEGFGIFERIPADQRKLVFNIQLKSPEIKKPTSVNVRATVKYVDGPTGMKMGLKDLSIIRWAFEEGQYTEKPLVRSKNKHHHHELESVKVDPYLLFMSPPGRHRFETEVTPRLNLESAKAHYIYAHLHAYAAEFEIVDLTDKKSIWKATVGTDRKNSSLEYLDVFSSVDGIPIFNNHKYKLIVVYDNPKKEPIDAMAMATLYYQ